MSLFSGRARMAAAGTSVAATVYFDEDFEEYSSGQTWTEANWNKAGVASTWATWYDSGNSNMIIYPTVGSGDSWLTHDADADVDVTVQIKESSANTLSGAIARFQDTNNFLLLEAVRNESKMKLYIRQSGTWTLLDEEGSISFGSEAMSLYRLVCNGNSVTGYRDGVQVVSYTLAGNETLGTEAGVYTGWAQINVGAFSATSP